MAGSYHFENEGNWFKILGSLCCAVLALMSGTEAWDALKLESKKMQAQLDTRLKELHALQSRLTLS